MAPHSGERYIYNVGLVPESETESQNVSSPMLSVMPNNSIGVSEAFVDIGWTCRMSERSLGVWGGSGGTGRGEHVQYSASRSELRSWIRTGPNFG